MGDEALEQEVTEWVAAWGAEVAAADIRSGRERFAEGLLAFGTHADVVVGRVGVEAGQWAQIWPAIEDFAFEIDELRVISSADGLMAVAIVPWRSFGINADGTRFDRPGRATIVLERTAHGEPWLGTHTHFSLARGRRSVEHVRQAPGDPMTGGRPVAHELAVMAEQVTARGVRGVVAAAAPLAAQAGAAALRDGGNAYDAAVAAALAETVLLPPKCGFGGDLVAIVIPGPGRDPESLIAIGGAAAGHADVARSGRWRDVGPDSVGPPAAAAGYAALAERGRLGRARLAEAAVELADDGFAWAEVCTRLSTLAAALVDEMQPEGCVFYPGGKPIAAGTIVRLPGLGEVLREWVERGGALLDGPVGDAIAREIETRGGALRAADFALASAEWVACSAIGLGDRRAWATPAPTHGPGLLAAVAEHVATGGDSVAGVHRAVMAAIERQRRELGDPGGTSMVSAGDASGTVVVIVHSNSYPRFGSGIVVPAYSLTLGNRAGRGFTAEPGHANFPERGRRPATTLHAWAVSDTTGAPRWAGGTPGGVNQLPWNAQTMSRLLAGEERPGMLVASPLWEWIPDDDGVRVEAGFPSDEVEALAAAAPRVVAAPRWGCKSAQQVVRVPAPGEAWEAAADPRTVGLALAV